MSVKFAQPEEITQIAALCGRSYNENDYSDLGIEADVDSTLVELAEAVAGGVVLVKRNDRNPKVIDGVLAFNFTSPWFSKTQYLHGLVFYIKEENRGTGLAREFLDTAKEYAIMNNIPLVFDIFGQKDAEKKKRLFKLMGFTDYGSTLVFIPKG